jgi:hypothetical protein
VNRLANKRDFRFAADALTARLVVKKFFFRFCSDKFLVKGFLLTWESPAGVDDTRRTEDLIEPTAVTCVGVDCERACINVARSGADAPGAWTKAMPVELPVTDVSGSRWTLERFSVNLLAQEVAYAARLPLPGPSRDQRDSKDRILLASHSAESTIAMMPASLIPQPINPTNA